MHDSHVTVEHGFCSACVGLDQDPVSLQSPHSSSSSLLWSWLCVWSWLIKKQMRGISRSSDNRITNESSPAATESIINRKTEAPRIVGSRRQTKPALVQTTARDPTIWGGPAANARSLARCSKSLTSGLAGARVCTISDRPRQFPTSKNPMK